MSRPRKRRSRADEDDGIPIRSYRGGPAVSPGLLVVGALGFVTLTILIALFVRSRNVSPTEPPPPKPPVQRQREPQRDVREPAAEPVNADPAVVAFGWMSCVVLCGFIYLLASVLLSIWVIRDCRNRSVENGLLWMLLIFPFNFLGLLIYLASRPHGLLVRCERCGNSRLSYVGICPHCRRDVVPRGRVS